uniref:Uncharacterized protein n=1 Tax=Gopherus agassizii TaxID=38772 RepID=A0A452IZQ3_9SAUR
MRRTRLLWDALSPGSATHLLCNCEQGMAPSMPQFPLPPCVGLVHSDCKLFRAGIVCLFRPQHKGPRSQRGLLALIQCE